MNRYRKADLGEVKAAKVTKDSAGELAALSHAVVVEEIDTEDPELRYVGLNVMWPHNSTPFRVSEGDYLVFSEKSNTFFGVNAAVFERQYQEV